MKKIQTVCEITQEQLRLWLDSQLESNSSLYNLSLSYQITGELNLTRLDEALTATVNHYSALRACFRQKKLKVQQLIQSSVQPGLLHIIDCTAKNKSQIDKIIHSTIADPFDLTQFPLHRFVLLKLNATHYHLIVVMHHIIADGYSLVAFLKTLSEFYNNPKPVDKKLQKAEKEAYIAHLQPSYTEQQKQHAIDYWRDLLQNEALSSPVDALKIPMSHTKQHAREYFSLSPSLNEKINQYRKEKGHSLFIILMSAFNALLYRYYSMQDFIVGYAINLRSMQAHETFGFFVNNLPLKVSITDNDTFTTLAEHLQQQRTADKPHQFLPLSEIVKLTERESVQMFSNTFSLMLGETSFPVLGAKHPQAGLVLTDLQVEPQRLSIKHSHGDLVMLYAKAEQLEFALDYNQDKFSAYHIQQFIQHYQSLLEWCLANPQQPISQAEILSSTERELLLTQFNQTKKDYPEKTIHQLFSEVAKIQGEQIALVKGDETLSYAALDEQSNRLAWKLQQTGIRPKAIVALCMHPNIRMVVAMLAILKVGAAYLPLDALHSKQHLEFMLKDAQVDVLLTQTDLGEIFKDFSGSIIHLDNDDLYTTPAPNLSFLHQGVPDDIAYVIYTSGSTGTPKGVCCTHRGIVNLVNDVQSRAPLTAGDKNLLVTSISFDVSVYEIWTALFYGCQLHILSSHIKDTSENLFEYISSQKISATYLPPFFVPKFSAAVEHNPSLFQSLKRLLVGVEPLEEMILIKIKNNIHGLKIINGYGPTEAAVIATLYSVSNQSISGSHRLVPLGKPVANYKLYILDKKLNPLPLGAVGELFIASVGISKEYLHRPELTTQKYITNPFYHSSDNKYYKKLYRTGDLVKSDVNGNLYFMGRVDDQIKIRGYRVELAAIELKLCQYPDIHEAIVLPEDDTQGNKFLAAYLLTSNKSLVLSRLKEFLHEHLAHYMVPSRYTLIEKIPRNKNGKVDKAALRELGKNLPPLATTYTPPRNSIEKKIATIWCEVLSLTSASIDDNFFNLGGHSLLVSEVLLRVRKQFKVDISMHDFFEKPTINFLAKLVGKKINRDSPFESQSRLLAMQDSQLEPLPHLVNPPQDINQTKEVLLTGVTGFLGVHILDCLLRSTDFKVYCIIRAENIMQAKERILTHMHRMGLNSFDEKRIVLLCGDIGETHFGLTQSAYIELARSIDIIYHSAAKVHHIYNYTELRRDNVLATLELIKFAAAEKTKYFHFVSTISSGLLGKDKHITEKFIQSTNELCPLFKGYAQSKQMAEYLLTKAKEKGLPVSIYRPGWITGHSKTGALLCEKDHYSLLIKGCIQLGYAPNWNILLNMNPVDIVSKFMVKTSLVSHGLNQVYNLFNSHLLNWVDLIMWLQAQGYSIKLMPSIEWYKKHLLRIQQDNVLYPLLAIYSKQAMIGGLMERDAVSSAKVDTSNAKKMLKELNMQLPLINDQLLKCYLDFYYRSGFLNKEVIPHLIA